MPVRFFVKGARGAKGGEQLIWRGGKRGVKAMEAIGQVDILEPNQYSVEQKLKWLAVLDGQVFEELIRDYYEQAVKPGEYRTGEEELLIPMPYAQSIYCRYLQAMIAAENFESAKYNQQIVLYNAAYQQFRDWVCRSRRHRNRGSGFRF